MIKHNQVVSKQYKKDLNVETKDGCMTCYAKYFVEVDVIMKLILQIKIYLNLFKDHCGLIKHNLALSMILFLKLYTSHKDKLYELLYPFQHKKDKVS